MCRYSSLLLAGGLLLERRGQAWAAPTDSAVYSVANATSATDAANSLTTNLPLSADPSMSFEMLVTVGEAAYHGADISDVLKASLCSVSGDFESFSDAFATLADAKMAEAEDPYNAKDPVNVRDTYFAAANYYRAADFYLHGNWSDPRINDYFGKSLYCFNHAISTLPVPGQRIQIPTPDGFTVEAIFYGVDPPSTSCKRKTIILGNGYDAAQEESIHSVGFAALERGWNVITYEGPGQPTVRRAQNLGFIPDWENVVTPVVDHLAARPDVDMDHLVLFGFSFGVYLAVRAAAFEPRLKAVVIDGGVYDAHQAFTGQLPPQLQPLYQAGQKQKLDAAIDQALANASTPVALRWGVQQGLWAFKIASPFDFLEATRPYNVTTVAARIHMPAWVVNAATDQFCQGQAPPVAAPIGPNTELYNLSGADGYHAQAGALTTLNRDMFAWLEEKLPTPVPSYPEPYPVPSFPPQAPQSSDR